MTEPKRLRILACTFACCPPGKPGFRSGEDVLGWNLLRQIGRFHEVWALAYAPNRPSIEQAVEEESISNIHFCYVDLPSWLRPLLRVQGGHQIYYHLWQLRAFFVARSLEKRCRFDLFHHITYANDWLASFVGALLPIPYVRGPGGGAHRTPKGLEKEYPLSGRVWEKIRTVGQWILRHDPLFARGQSRAHAILVCNRESMAQVPSKWAHKVQIFPVSGISQQDLGVDTPTEVDDSRFRILSAGSLIKIKGFGLAIKAFGKFIETHPEASLTIIGSGPEESRLRALVRRSRLEDKVQFLEWMPRHQLLTQMAMCDVFLFPSLRDGGGTVVVEAMAIGKPVVCLDTGGPGMHITEEYGVKVTPGSREQTVERLKSALERLFEDKDLRLKMGQAARRRAQQVYQWDALGERLTNIYQTALRTEN